MATKITLRANKHYPAFDDGDERNDIRNAEFHAYCKGATDQIKLAKDWIRNNYGRFDGKVEDFVSDFEKAMTL